MRRPTTTCQNLSLRRLLFIFDVIAILIILIIIIVFIAIIITRSYAALQAADLDWIVRPGYKLGRVHFGVFSTSRFVPLALSSDWRGVTTDLGAGISKNVTNAGSQLSRASLTEVRNRKGAESGLVGGEIKEYLDWSSKPPDVSALRP